MYIEKKRFYRSSKLFFLRAVAIAWFCLGFAGCSSQEENKPVLDITALSYKGTYNGKAHKINGFENETSKGIEVDLDGETYYVSGLLSDESGIDVTDSKKEIEVYGDPKVVNSAGDDVSDKVKINIHPGSFIIEPTDLYITSGDATKEYDGTPLTNGGQEIKYEEGWIDGEGASYNFTGKQIIVGEGKNTFELIANQGTDINNYNIIKEEGTLTVVDRKEKFNIDVNAKSLKVQYDGNEHKISDFENENMNGIEVFVNEIPYFVKGLSSNASATEIKESIESIPIEGEAIVQDEMGNDVTAQFKVNATNGSLIITKADVVLTSQDIEKEYDGKPLLNEEKEIIAKGFIGDDGVTCTFTGSQTIVGESENIFTYEFTEGTDADNYNITVENGTLTVTDREEPFKIEVEANSYSGPYDGKEHFAFGFVNDTKQGTEVLMNDLTYYVTGLKSEQKGKDVADSVNKIEITGESTVKDDKGNDVTDQFIVVTEPGSLKIQRADVVIESTDIEKEYSGKELTNGKTELKTCTGFASNEGINVTYSGTQLSVGESKNSFDYTFKDNTNPDNYNITKKEGKLKVIEPSKKIQIPVKGKSLSVTYDGDEHSVEGFENETEKGIKVNVDGAEFFVTGLSSEESGWDTIKTSITYSGTPKVKDSTGKDVTKYCDVNVTAGTFEIKEKPKPKAPAYSPTVYVSKNNIYHSRSNCSGMKYYDSMSLSDAQNRGARACQKCY